MHSFIQRVWLTLALCGLLAFSLGAVVAQDEPPATEAPAVDPTSEPTAEPPAAEPTAEAPVELPPEPTASPTE